MIHLHTSPVSRLCLLFLTRVWPKYICIYGSACPLKSMYILPPGTWKVARFLSRKMHFNASSICLSSVLCLSVVETCVGQRMCRHFSHFIPSPSRILSSFVYFLLRIFLAIFQVIDLYMWLLPKRKLWGSSNLYPLLGSLMDQKLLFKKSCKQGHSDHSL